MPEPVFTQEERRIAVRALQPHSSYDHGRFGAFVGFNHALKLQLELNCARDIIEQYRDVVDKLPLEAPIKGLLEVGTLTDAFLERTAP